MKTLFNLLRTFVFIFFVLVNSLLQASTNSSIELAPSCQQQWEQMQRWMPTSQDQYDLWQDGEGEGSWVEGQWVETEYVEVPLQVMDEVARFSIQTCRELEGELEAARMASKYRAWRQQEVRHGVGRGGG